LLSPAATGRQSLLRVIGADVGPFLAVPLNPASFTPAASPGVWHVLFAFPVADLVRAVLDKRISYLTRLALAWLRPTELRELRAEILAVSKDSFMPSPVRDLAGRLVVPA
jgi:hypothetical protein